ncbi:helix-turn-helix domain-containing protein, partial [Bacteroides thetaiotaomicron]|uniref:helix-turn-helix domain-containing protein n=1 Tax=Bacteroides thetaiotaomicron TaxID=818 RepID=UPI00325FFC3D
MEISMATQSREIGIQAKNKPGHWVQTERKAHEAWAGLIARKPTAAMLLHHLVAQMGHQNAVVVSQKTLSKLIGRSLRTVQYAVKDLVAERWISVVKLNGPGTVSAYVVNDRVAWGQPRDQLRLSVFSAAVVVDHDDQDESLLGHGDLRRIPTLYPA